MYTDRRGYQLFDITPREWVTSVKVIDKVSEPGGIMSTLGVYAAEPHQAKLHKR
jgi:alkaline phosphatase D